MYIKYNMAKNKDVRLIPCDYFLGIEDIILPLDGKIKTKNITVRKNKTSVKIYDDKNILITDYKVKKSCISVYTGWDKWNHTYNFSII